MYKDNGYSKEWADTVELNYNKRQKLQGLFSIFECHEDKCFSTSLVSELKLKFLIGQLLP